MISVNLNKHENMNSKKREKKDKNGPIGKCTYSNMGYDKQHIYLYVSQITRQILSNAVKLARLRLLSLHFMSELPFCNVFTPILAPYLSH